MAHIAPFRENTRTYGPGEERRRRAQYNSHQGPSRAVGTS